MNPLRVAVGKSQGDRPSHGHTNQVEAVEAQGVDQPGEEVHVGVDRGQLGHGAAATEARQVGGDGVVAAAQLRHHVAEHPGGSADPAVKQDERLGCGGVGDGLAEKDAATVDIQRAVAVIECSWSGGGHADTDDRTVACDQQGRLARRRARV